MSEALGQQNNQVPTDSGEADLTDTSPARGAGPNARVVPAGPGNVVTLPADAVIQEVTADGRDLVITLQDGTQIVIPDGAIILPQLLVGNTPIPPANLAALLVDGEPEPAAGNTPSSGGDFFVDPGNIQSAFDIGDLLPYTELSRLVVEDQEIIPQPLDRDPDITIEPDDSGVSVINAEDAVNEAGLPEGVPPARGAGEPEGTDSASDSEDTYGFINFSSPDGTSSISLNGVEIDLDGSPIGQTFTTDLGILTIVSVEPGRIGYTYKLLDNTTDPTSADFFEVTITDPDGDTATATLRIDIIDDAPIGMDDEGTVPQGSHAEITGNVLTNDIPGADNFPVNAGVTGFSQGEETAAPGGSIHGTYGTLVLNANGTYSYIRDYNTPGGVQESFDYTIVDQDGSVSQATLTINILNAPDTVNVPDTGEGTQVDEGGLPPRDGGTVGTGEIADDIPDNNSDTTETTGSTITFNSPDGVGSITIDGTPIDLDGPFPQTVVDNDKGTLVVTDYTYDPVTGDGSITYEYTLDDNTSGDDTSVSFEIIVTDLDGDTAPGDLVIDIIDDQPIARPDVDSVTEGATATGNVLTGEGTQGGTDGVGMDTPGADGYGVAPNGAVTGIESENVPANSDFEASEAGAFVVAGQYGTLTIYRDGSYSYKSNADTIDEPAQDVFTYHIKDGDGSEAEATLTINLRPVTLVADNESVGVNEASLDLVQDDRAPAGPSANDDLAPGTVVGRNPDSVLETATGQLDVEGAVSYSLDGAATGNYGLIKLNSDGSFTYTLTKAVDGDTLTPDQGGDNGINTYANGIETFSYTATDANGNTVHGTITIDITDDIPIARDDSDSVTQGAISTDGNVITGVGTDDGLGGLGADTKGADGASVTTTGTFNGTYGDLVLGSDGQYTYTLNDLGKALILTLDENETLEDPFDYTLTDGDGDVDEATLTIVLKGTDDGVEITGLNPNANVPEEILDEDDLSDGSSPLPAALEQTGTFGVNSPDGMDDVTAGTTDIVINGVFQGAQEVANDGVYKVEITGWTPVYAVSGNTSTPVISATFAYKVTLLDNTLAHDELGQDDIVKMLAIHATDQDSDFDDDVLDTQIIDDVPTARDDGDSVTEGSISTDGNVITGAGTDGGLNGAGADTKGADGATVTTTGTFNGTYGDLVLGSDGEYTYTLNDLGKALIETLDENETLQDAFDYTLTDSDLDTFEATLTIVLKGTDDGVTIRGFNEGNNVDVPEVILDEDDLANIGDDQGSDQNDPLSYDKSFTVDAPDGLGTVTMGTETLVTGGVYVGGTVTVINDGIYKVEVTGWTPTYAVPLDDTTPVVSATFDYTVTLLDNTLAHTGLDDLDLTHMIDVHATDEDGDFDDDVLDVQIVDDVPDASDNANEVDEGQTVGGNLLTDNDGDGVDVSGADGYHVDGAVISIRTADSSKTDASYDGDGNLSIETDLGILTVNKDGTYTYESKVDSTNADTGETFYYTIKDGDGDTSEAKLVIDITNAPGEVSDDDLTVDEAYLDTASYTGSEAGNGLPQASGSVTVNGATGTLVYILDSAPAGTYGTLTWDGNGGYTYTLTKPYTDGVVENTTNTVENADSFAYHVEDGVGNFIGDGVITIDIIDDVPTARDDDAQQIAEDGGTLDGNVINPDIADDPNQSGADTFGADDNLGVADDAVLTHIDIGGGMVLITSGVETAPNSGVWQFENAAGHYTITADGDWTFTPKLNQSGEPVDASFDYRITDADDDYSEATQPITVTDGEDPSVEGSVSLQVDEAALDLLGTGDLAPGAVEGTDPTQTDETDASGASNVMTFTSGSDDITSIKFADPTALGTTPTITSGLEEGTTIVWTLSVDGRTLTGAIDGTDVIILQLSGDQTALAGGNDVTPVVTVTLTDAFPHQDDVNADTLTITNIGVTASEADGDHATGFVTVEVIDDLPVLKDATVTKAVQEDALTPDGNPDSGSDTLVATGSLAGLVDFGADKPGSFTLDASHIGDLPVLTSNDVTVEYKIIGDTLYGFTGDAGATPADVPTGLVFTLQVGSDGAYTFTLIDQLDHEGPLASANSDGDDQILTLDFSDVVKATDADGDSVNLDGQFTITVEDDLPAPSGETVSDHVEEDALDPEGNPDSISDTLVATGSLAGLVDFGADQPGSFKLDAANIGDLPALTSNDVAVEYKIIGNTLYGFTGSAGANPADIPTGLVFTLQVESDGGYTFTLLDQLDHEGPLASANSDGDAQILTLDFSDIVVAVDADDDELPLDGVFTITVEDDLPAPSGETESNHVEEDALGNGSPDSVSDTLEATGTVADLIEFGADQPGSFKLDDTNIGDLAKLTSNNLTVNYAIVGDTLYAYTGSGTFVNDVPTTGLVFTLQVESDGDYTFTLLDQLDHVTPDLGDNYLLTGSDDDQILTLDFSDIIVAVDADNDELPLDGVFTITVEDDIPVQTGSPIIKGVVEDLLSGGNPDGGIGDATTAQAELSTLVTKGADQPGSFTPTLANVSDLPVLTSNGAAVNYILAGEIIYAYTGSGTIVSGVPTTGVVFTLQVESDGHTTFTLLGPLDHVAPDANDNYTLTGSDDDQILTLDFSKAIVYTDSDGDKVTLNGAFKITVEDDLPIANPDGDSVTEDTNTSTGGNVITGAGTTGGAGGAGTDSDGADAQGAVVGAAVGTVSGPLSGSLNTTLYGSYGTLTIAADGTYTYTLYTLGQDGGAHDAAYNAVQALSETSTPLTDVFSYTFKDGDTDTSTTQLTITINGSNDAPVPVADTGVLSDEGLPGGNPDNSGTPTDTTDAKSDSGQITITDVDDSTFTVTFGTPSTSLGGNTVVWVPSNGGHTLTGSIGGTPTIQLTIDNSGNWTATLLAPIPHSNTSAEDVISGFVIPVNVSDGTTSVGSTITLAFEDDSPTPISPETAILLNQAGSFTGSLDADLNIDDNVGGDQPGTIAFSSTLTAPGYNSGLTYSGDPIKYALIDGGQTLLGYTGNTVPTATSDGSVVFYVELNPDGALATANDLYTITVVHPLDGGESTIDFAGTGYEAYGSNADWNGFVPVGDDLGTKDTNGSNDLLITPVDSNGGNDVGSVNNNASTFGAGGDGGGQAIGSGEGLRLDFVTDLYGNPASGAGNYTTLGNRDHNFDVHYNVLAVSIGIQIDSGESSALFRVYENSDANDQVYGAGTLDDISAIQIVHNGTTSAKISVTNGAVNVGGQIYQVVNNNDGTFTVKGLQSTDFVRVYGDADGFDALEVIYVDGGTDGDRPFAIYGFQTSIVDPGATVDLSLPIVLSDSDGDTSIGTLDASLVPPDPTFTKQFAAGGGDLDSNDLSGLGTESADTINGNALDNFIAGFGGADELHGGGGDDRLFGGEGSDTLYGDANNDILTGGLGADTLYGGSGNDVFVIDASEATTVSYDTIADYAAGDVIDLTDVLTVANGVDPVAGGYVRYYGNALQVDLSGGGNDWNTVAMLTNTNPASVAIRYTETGTGTVAANLAQIVPPIVLDLDGGGNAFTGLAGGVSFDYDGDGVKSRTAWIAAGSAILFYDANGDGLVSSASEFSFGHDGMSDLEAVAAMFDDNGDGVLDVSDASYGKFGVWLDSNLNGESDAGETVSLHDAGIASIDLTSDAVLTSAADGDVTISGTSTFTWDDGTTGEVSDAAFATGGEIDGAMMDALLAMADAPADDGEAVLVTQDQGEVQAVVADALAEDAVDAVVADYSAPDADAPVLASADDGSHPALEALLYSNIGDEGGRIHEMVLVDPMDDASMAVVAQA